MGVCLCVYVCVKPTLRPRRGPRAKSGGLVGNKKNSVPNSCSATILKFCRTGQSQSHGHTIKGRSRSGCAFVCHVCVSNQRPRRGPRAKKERWFGWREKKISVPNSCSATILKSCRTGPSYIWHDLVPVLGLYSQNKLIFHCIHDLF